MADAVKKKRGGCRGCLKWIGIILLVLIILGAIVAALLYRVPEKLGLVPSKAEKLLVMTPDREAGAELLAEARARGLNTQGVSLYIFPYKDSAGSIATATFDSREGFTFTQGGQLNPIAASFSQVAGGPT